MRAQPRGPIVSTGRAAPLAGTGERADNGWRSALPSLAAAERWTDAAVERCGLPVHDVALVTVGGGLASFALVDFLRIAGVPTRDVAVVSPQRLPHASWQHLVRTSQIPDDEPLRSDSMSRMDNIWGWPGYAFQEAMRERSPWPLWNVLTEPVCTDFYNPKAGLVYTGIEREAARIGWDAMLVPGHAEVSRRRDPDGFFTLVAPASTGNHGEPLVLYRSRHVHLGVGYPAVRLLGDVQAYRDRHGDLARVVNAYEPHEHVYEALLRRPATVVVRGAGIVASRVLERILDDRDRHGAHSRVVHLLRTVPTRATGPLRYRRPAGDGWNYQPFTFAKAAGGGQLRRRTLQLEGAARAEFIKSMGGTTTARRRHWQRQLREGRRQGFYRLVQGEVTEMAPERNGVCLVVEGSAGSQVLHADFVVDCTGFDPDIRRHPLLADLLDHGGAGRNPMGRLDVDPHFVVRGAGSGTGRLYASGAMTLGGYLAPVDSFWGFSHAALEICDDLSRAGLCQRIGVRRSVRGWWRWARSVAP